MILINTSNKKVISKNLKIAESLLDNTLGLLKEKKNTALLFKTRFGIHTLFMKYPLDILVLNESLKIVRIKKNIKPNRIFFWNPIYSLIIELPSGEDYPSKVGDTLKIKY